VQKQHARVTPTLARLGDNLFSHTSLERFQSGASALRVHGLGVVAQQALPGGAFAAHISQLSIGVGATRQGVLSCRATARKIPVELLQGLSRLRHLKV
jgi:hypothetical protein